MSANPTSMETPPGKPILSFSIERILYGNFKTEDVKREGKHSTMARTPGLEVSRKMQGKLSNYPKFGKVGGNILETVERYKWLDFTRYNPPKLPKSNKPRIKKKRNPGRNPRVPFTPKQLTTLEGKFQKMKYLSNDDVSLLRDDLSLPEQRIKIWFQNRRAREKKKSQDEYVDVTGLEEH